MFSGGYELPKQTNVQKGSSRKVGNHKAHCERYRQRGSLLKNKIKKIAKSNGLKAVESYRHDPTRKFPKEEK